MCICVWSLPVSAFSSLIDNPNFSHFILHTSNLPPPPHTSLHLYGQCFYSQTSLSCSHATAALVIDVRRSKKNGPDWVIICPVTYRTPCLRKSYSGYRAVITDHCVIYMYMCILWAVMLYDYTSNFCVLF